MYHKTNIFIIYLQNSEEIHTTDLSVNNFYYLQNIGKYTYMIFKRAIQPKYIFILQFYFLFHNLTPKFR